MFDRAVVGTIPSSAKALRYLLKASAILFFVGCGDHQSATNPAHATPQGTARASLAFASFAGAPVTLRGSATVTGTELVLTSGSNQVGAAWSGSKQRLSKYWESSFQFRIEPATCGANSIADGFTFAVQNTAANALATGTQGSDLGYSGFSKALVVEFDVLNSGDVYFDNSDNQVAVVSGGQFQASAKLAPLKRVAPPIRLKDGAMHAVKVTYDRGSLSVAFDDGPAALTVPVDLNNVNNNGSILDANGNGWVGFTGSTGGWCAKQRIMNWSFVDNRAPVASVASASYDGLEGAPMTMTATATDPDGDNIASYEWDLDSDGTVDATTTSSDLTHSFLKPGTFAVSVVAVDAAGARSVAASTRVSIDNVAPTVSAPAQLSTLVGDEMTFAASFADPGTDGGPWSYHIEWGDGSPATDGVVDAPARGIAATHVFARSRSTPYLVDLTVADKATASGTSQTSVRAGQVEVAVTLANLAQVYDGRPRNVAVVTNPANVAVSVNYDNASAVPVNAGEYDVLVSVTDPRYVGGATGKLVVEKAPIGVRLTGLTGQVYDGAPKQVTASVAPAGVAVVVSYNGGPAPVDAGSYTVVARVDDPNYAGSESGTMVVGRASATIELDQLAHTYDGLYKFARARTTPAGLTTVSLTYNGSAQGPAGAGSYAVVASLDNSNYEAADAVGTLVISQAAQTLTFGNLDNHVFGDEPFTVRAQPGASMSPVTFTLGASSVGCSLSGPVVTISGATAAGQSCTVVAHQGADANYLAAADVARSFTIDRAGVHVVWATPASVFAGTPLGAEQLNASATNASGAPVAGTFTYSPAAGTILTAGTQLLTAAFQPSTSNYNSGTATVQLTVTPAPPPPPPPASGINFLTPNAQNNVFKAGHHIPVVFEYTNAAAAQRVALAKLKLSKAKVKVKNGRGVTAARNAEPEARIEVKPLLANGSEGAAMNLRDGDEFRSTSRSDWYWYDLETKGWRTGAYRIWAILEDGSRFSVDIRLR